MDVICLVISFRGVCPALVARVSDHKQHTGFQAPNPPFFRFPVSLGSPVLTDRFLSVAWQPLISCTFSLKLNPLEVTLLGGKNRIHLSASYARMWTFSEIYSAF
jgi:hypothetical protein